ncbi:MAG: flagellar basal body L-ring protein FlgH [Campylobacterales bacterium]|nr:flagellar basal body L-ring protein FlgH [Campylobacterales bacterium]
MKKTALSIFIPLCATLILSGCTAGLTDPDINFEPPVYVDQMPAKENDQDFVSTGSIFGQGDNPLFSDHKAMHANDIVKVVISEIASSSNTGAKALSESDTSAMGGGLITPTGGGIAGTIAGEVNKISDVGYTAKSTSAYKGSGSATKDAKFATTITARIVKVLQNGNYFITGKREILIDDQKQIVQISGVIRPYDIDQYNSINSNKMSEAKIQYKTQGDVDRATKQGWGTKALQSIMPF